MIEEQTFDLAYMRLQREMTFNTADVEIISIVLSPIIEAIEAKKKEGVRDGV